MVSGFVALEKSGVPTFRADLKIGPNVTPSTLPVNSYSDMTSRCFDLQSGPPGHSVL
ncbi:hypothetical protein FHS42_006627 [Streptomyces zagrosensis]|uniref:Uncharacterized protein n=1 Tax=Streptomyces zagrosensis TaxID=1042984 RepID=A0A7W9QFY2_9ACTN|nr:hypothetical protein [Streptomyces zagrosensis]